jgi:DNA-binding MarR family transcriptional regulator
MSDGSGARRELAAQFFRLSRALIAAETPLLAANGIGMWDYVVLGALVKGGTSTQLELAKITGRDKTRLIANLDVLTERGLVSRRPDPDDRRARIVEITAAGRQTVTDCRDAIRRMEDEFLTGISAKDQREFHRVLGLLTSKVGKPDDS